MGLQPINLTDELAAHFGFAAFRPGQEAVVQALVEGHSALALFPTGAGKSLCYQLPALLREGTALVVSPLIALMKDQVDGLRRRGIAAARLDSTLTPEEAAAVEEELADGKLKLLYVAPERLTGDAFIARLRRVKLSLMAVDEAHCISEWGHSFRPEYLRLARVARKLRIKTVLALTATATPAVAKDILRSFKIRRGHFVQTSFHRPNLHLKLAPLQADERPAHLAERLQHPAFRPAIVYVTRQETAGQVATQLKKVGFQAQAYHAGLPDELRAAAQEAFLSGACDVMVATMAFGMGIDKPDLRAVFHYNLPRSLENYLQETGRAGRDGQQAHCEMLGSGEDRIVLENFLHGDTPTPAAVQSVVHQVLRAGDTFDLSRHELSQSFDLRPHVVESILTQLELGGLIAPTHSFSSSFRLTLRRPMDKILAGHPPGRRRLLKKMFSAARPDRGWQRVIIDDAVAAEVKVPLAKLAEAVGWLEQMGDLSARAWRLRHAFRRLMEPARIDLPAVTLRLQKHFQQREIFELARLDDVFALIRDPGCTVRHLLNHFGEKMPADCGHCDRCVNPVRKAVRFSAPPPPPLTMAHLAVIQQMRTERHAALRGPRQLAKFLCGLTSPATLREKLTRHDAFGLLSEMPFATVLAEIETLGW